MRAIIKKAISHVGPGMPIRIAAVGMSFLVQVLMVKLTSVNAYGEYVNFIFAASFISVMGRFGCETVVLREVAGMASLSQRKIFITSKVILVFLLTMFLGVPVSFMLIFLDLTYSKNVAVLSVFGAMITSVFMISIAAQRGLMNIWAAELLDNLLRPLLMVIVVASVAYFVSNVNGVGMSVFYILTTCVVFFIAIRGNLSLVSFGDVRKVWNSNKGGGLIMIASIASFGTFQADKLLLVSYVPANELGAYNMACNFVRIVPFVSLIVSAKMQPELSAAWVLKDYSKFKRIVFRGFVVTGLFSLPSALLLFLFGGEILGAVATDYREYSHVLSIIAVGHIFNSFAIIFGAALLMARKDGSNLVFQFVMSVFAILGCIFLSPLYGVLGAAIAASFAMMIGFLISLYLYKRNFNEILVSKV